MYLVYCTHNLKKMKSRIPWKIALLWLSREFFTWSQCSIHVSWPVHPLWRMWQWALDKWFTLPLTISQIISQHTPLSLDSICPRNDDGTHSVRLMKHVVLVFQDPHGSIWPMIVTMQKWFMISNLLIQNRSELDVCSIVAGGWFIIAIMISRIWALTSANHLFYYIY